MVVRPRWWEGLDVERPRQWGGLEDPGKKAREDCFVTCSLVVQWIREISLALSADQQSGKKQPHSEQCNQLYRCQFVRHPKNYTKQLLLPPAEACEMFGL